MLPTGLLGNCMKIIEHTYNQPCAKAKFSLFETYKKDFSIHFYYLVHKHKVFNMFHPVHTTFNSLQPFLFLPPLSSVVLSLGTFPRRFWCAGLRHLSMSAGTLTWCRFLATASPKAQLASFADTSVCDRFLLFPLDLSSSPTSLTKVVYSVESSEQECELY